MRWASTTEARMTRRSVWRKRWPTASSSHRGVAQVGLEELAVLLLHRLVAGEAGVFLVDPHVGQAGVVEVCACIGPCSGSYSTIASGTIGRSVSSTRRRAGARLRRRSSVRASLISSSESSRSFPGRRAAGGSASGRPSIRPPALGRWRRPPWASPCRTPIVLKGVKLQLQALRGRASSRPRPPARGIVARSLEGTLQVGNGWALP